MNLKIRRIGSWKTGTSMVTAAVLKFSALTRGHAEDHLDYKYDDYIEERDRMHISTHTALFEKGLGQSVTLKGQYVYDAISGATPTGAPPPAGSSQVPTVEIEDERNAGLLEAAVRWGRHTTTPQVSYSLENDYESDGVSLNHSIDFNEKNTILNLGVADAYDTIKPKFWDGNREFKNSLDFLVGVSQLFSPTTVGTANFTYGYSSGYLSDPYKGVRFDGYPDPNSVFPEKRPGYRNKEILYLSLTQFVKPVNGSAEVSYRFYHDSFGIFSHTAGLTWYQRLGRHVILAPMFRYYQQTAADFYAPRFPGDPSDPTFPVPPPTYYSADYRLSALHTFTYGLQATIIIKDWLYLDAAYKRYEMSGDDSATADSNYPDANVFTVGLRVWF